MSEAAPILRVTGLTIHLHTRAGPLPAVDTVDLTVNAGQTLGIVGESGCGKSMLALSLLGLQPNPPAQIAAGRAEFEGMDLMTLSPEAMRRVRGRRIAMIFQEPLTALNPVMRVGEQIAESCRRHLGMSHRAARARAVEMLDRVRVPDPARRARDYPYQLSGGLRQRVMIAAALACEPALLIADEPTTALDVTIQAQILALLAELQADTGMAVILITHDLGVIAETADRVMVMYAGRKVEEAPVEALFARPQHPYTMGLLGSVPVVGRSRGRMTEIGGRVPPLDSLPPGCAFAPRCNQQVSRCTVSPPGLAPSDGIQRAACYNPGLAS